MGFFQKHIVNTHSSTITPFIAGLMCDDILLQSVFAMSAISSSSSSYPSSLRWAFHIPSWSPTSSTFTSALDLLASCIEESVEVARIRRFYFPIDAQRALVGRLALRHAVHVMTGNTDTHNTTQQMRIWMLILGTVSAATCCFEGWGGMEMNMDVVHE